MLSLIAKLEQQLVEALKELETLKAALGAPTPEPLEPGAFSSRLAQAVNAAFGHQADFTPETYARLYELSGGDADTVVDLIDRLGWRAKQGRPVDSPAAYAVSVVRKVGIATLRAERIRRGGAPPVPNQPAAQTNGMAPTMNGAAPQPNVAPPVAPTFQAPAGFSWTSPEAAAVADHTRAAQ